jgi:hypothetical protein
VKLAAFAPTWPKPFPNNDKGNTMTKPSDSKANPMAAAVDTMAALNPLQAGPMKAMFAVGTETMQFLSARMQQDLEAQREMLACKTFAELQTVQAKFYSTALEDYRRATAKMMEIMATAGSNVSGTGTSGTKRSYDDVPL